MAAFDRINSGIPALDTALDNIRLGDNVVWRVSGSRWGELFLPCAAGVGYSASPYRLGTEHPEAALLFSHDYDAERAFRERGLQKKVLFTSCDGLVHSEGQPGASRFGDCRRVHGLFPQIFGGCSGLHRRRCLL